jgi:hypothetical protein
MPLFIKIKNILCQKDFFMFFCISIKTTAAISIASYINSGSLKINLPCLYRPTGKGRGETPKLSSYA